MHKQPFSPLAGPLKHSQKTQTQTHTQLSKSNTHTETQKLQVSFGFYLLFAVGHWVNRLSPPPASDTPLGSPPPPVWILLDSSPNPSRNPNPCSNHRRKRVHPLITPKNKHFTALSSSLLSFFSVFYALSAVLCVASATSTSDFRFRFRLLVVLRPTRKLLLK